jgi:transposase InsO family protein
MYYPNLIKGLVLTNKNQVIQTDITYFIIGEEHYYLVFIIDVYTRLIIGYNVSRTLKATENIKALQMGIKMRQQTDDNLENMIHHSDKGSQYIDKDYLDLLQQHKIIISMCDYAWENAYTERINRTIKEEYLETMEINDFAALKKAVYLYNHERPHQSIQQMTPVQFEQYIKSIDENQRPRMKLYEAPVEAQTKTSIINKEKQVLMDA